MPICKKCSKPYFHETNYENLCCKCYDKQNEKIYHCYPELTIIKIIVYAYDKFNIDELKRFNKYGQLKENNISLKRIIPIVAIIIKAILYIRVFKRIITLLTR